jgi:8-oxo-dGTP pyrophosphatase MutT (NUDIX family)
LSARRPGVVAAALDLLPPGPPLSCPSARVAGALRAAGRGVELVDLGEVADGVVDALVLGDDELSRAGDHAEGLVDRAGGALRPGGLLLASARTPLLLQAGDGALRGFTSRQLAAALSHRGFTVEQLTSPGAAARVRGAADPAYDRELDRWPGLLDAGSRVVALARAPGSASERSATFFATVPRKVVAASVLCRDAAGRLLVVHDAFRRYWTLPGGVVDADEDPRSGAEREAWEEAGVRVSVGALLGVFSSSWPDRLILVYAAAPRAEPAAPAPVHAHEVDAAAWLPLPDALARLAPAIRYQVERCLDRPGGTWRQ